jgi:branched-chain amino acid transport system ATP-binding protein
MLEVDGITLGYGPIEVVHDLSLTVPDGAIVAILGRNGAGKTTTLSGIAGLLRTRTGSIKFNGKSATRMRVSELARSGLAYVPEGRGVLPGLTVRENLAASAYGHGLNRRTTVAEIKRVTEYFPIIEARAKQRAGTLSGGEQQMLVIARALISRPSLLMVDEPGLGLAPVIVQSLYQNLTRLNEEEGLGILLVEQYVDLALATATYSYLLEKGRVVVEGDRDRFDNSPELVTAYTG